ncbi:MAG TPA: serine hydrolase domain-containing protein [Kofleriaceae bacterium]
MKLGAACLAGLVVVLLSSAVFAEAPPRNLDELRARVAQVLLREHVPGAGIALVDGPRILWAGGVGTADRASGRPVTADTLFRTGSITKSFVALALVKLAEQGRVDLNARVGDLAPELAIANRWDTEQPITVAHLLEHTAGFDDMHPNEMYAPLPAEAMPLAKVLARNPASRVARWRPGSRFSYANPGYTVAAYILEKVTGRSYEDVLERQILGPLGMTGAALRWTPEVERRLARGYDDGDAPVPYRAIYHRPAGNLMASPRELAALVQLALARGRIGGAPLISPAGMARIERSETARLDAGDASYGLGNYGDVSERALIRGHNGRVPGFLSLYGYLPGQDVGYVLLLNSTSARAPRAQLEIRHLLVEYLLAGAPVPPPPRAIVPEDELRRWVGTYHSAAPRHQLFAFLERALPGLELFVDRGRLYARSVPAAGEPIEIVPLGGDRFRVPWASAGHVAFGRDPEGRRIFVVGSAYFVEEPRSRALAYAIVPVVCLWLLATGFVFPLARLRRRVGPSPGLGWPLCVSLAFFAVPRLFLAAIGAAVWGELNLYTAGIFVGTLAFAAGSIGSAVQALLWLPLPGSILGKLHRLLFAAAACCATAYLAAYGIIGVRLWSY